MVSTDECDGAIDGPSDPCQEDPVALTTAKDVCYGLIDPDGKTDFVINNKLFTDTLRSQRKNILAGSEIKKNLSMICVN